MEDVARNTVIRLNDTTKYAKELGQTILWCKYGPLNLNDPAMAVSSDMLKHFDGTMVMKAEGGVVPGYKYDRLLLKNPINCGELNLNVNTNADLWRFMHNNFSVPVILKE